MLIPCVWLFFCIKTSWVHSFIKTIPCFLLWWGITTKRHCRKKYFTPVSRSCNFMYKTTDCIFEFVWNYILADFCFIYQTDVLLFSSEGDKCAFSDCLWKWHALFGVYDIISGEHVSLTSIKTADFVKKMQLLII